VLTNASIINSTFVYCDTPSLLNKQGYVVDGGEGAWFDVYISLDGGSEISDSNGRFEYYQDPVIYELNPALGPQTGNTIVTVNGTGFDQNTTCGTYIRLGLIEITPMNITNETLTFKTPHSPFPGTAAVSFTLNGQQYSKQPAVSDLPKELTFDYYEAPYTTFYYPTKGPSNGANFQRHQGFGFMLGRPHLNDRMWARMVNPEKGTNLTEDIEISSDNLHIDEWTWYMPSVSGASESLIQITLNQQQWHDVTNVDTGKSYTYYAAPHVTSITPAFGHVKTSKDQVIEVGGTGFACYDEDCADLMCRFGNDEDSYIYVRATLSNAQLIRCKVP